MSSLLTPTKPAEPQILVGQASPGAKPPRLVDGRDLHVIALWFGIALGLVTLVNFGLLWWDPKFGNAEWEFGVIGQTFDRVPLLVVSFVLIAYGAIASGSFIGTRIVAAVFAATALWLVGCTVVYGMASLTAMKLVPGNQISAIRRTVAKNLGGSVIYIVLFAAATFQMWRRTRQRFL